jgi:hypothetical protein
MSIAENVVNFDPFPVSPFTHQLLKKKKVLTENKPKSAETAFGMTREQLAARSAANRAIEDREDAKYDNLRRKRWGLQQEASRAQSKPASDTPTGTC